MSALESCPSCASPLRIPTDSTAQAFVCPRCNVQIPNPNLPRPGRHRLTDTPDIRPRQGTEPGYGDDEDRRQPRPDRPPGTDMAVVGVILSSVTLVAALGCFLYLQIGPPFAADESMTIRKHASGILTVISLFLVVGITLSAIFVAQGHGKNARVAGLILTIVGGFTTLLLTFSAATVFMVSSCLEPCDSKSRQPPVPPAQKQKGAEFPRGHRASLG